jgi:uncharacterized membrane protein YeaQ/YmgE (transglycosylase-associated protein family)
MDLSSGGIVAWLAVGLVTGWAAGKVSRGQSFGIIGDLAVGLIGALLGGLIAGLLFDSASDLTWSIVVAFAGSVLLLTVLRVLSRRRMTA